jgi:tetratricopeptide (TPR) repeat protein
VLFRQIGDWRFLAHTLGILGYTVLSNGDLEAAEKYLDEAYEVNQQINNIEIEFVLTGKGILCMLRGEYDRARTFLRKNIEDHEKTGDRMGYLWGRARLAQVALREGSVTEAHQILMDTIENFHADQSKNGLAFALDRMASVYVLTGKPEVAARLIGWSDATRQEIGDPRPRIEQADLDEAIAAIRARIGADAYETAYNSGWHLALDEVVAFALAGKN